MANRTQLQNNTRLQMVRVIPVGKEGFVRKAPKRVDFLLRYTRDFVLAVVEAKATELLSRFSLESPPSLNDGNGYRQDHCRLSDLLEALVCQMEHEGRVSETPHPLLG